MFNYKLIKPQPMDKKPNFTSLRCFQLKTFTLRLLNSNVNLFNNGWINEINIMPIVVRGVCLHYPFIKTTISLITFLYLILKHEKLSNNDWEYVITFTYYKIHSKLSIFISPAVPYISTIGRTTTFRLCCVTYSISE